MYSYQRIITIDKDQISGRSDFTDFPFLFSESATYLETVANGGKIQNSNGYDIIFTLGPDISSKLDHEVVKYDSVTGEFIAFVRLPTLFHYKDTTIYLHYGDSSIDNSQENTTGVWGSNFRAVYHLEEITAGVASEIQDSTKNIYHGYGGGINGNLTTRTSGKFGYGQQLIDAYDLIDLPSTLLNGVNDIRISFWFKTSKSGQLSFLSGAKSADANEIIILFIANNALQIWTHGNLVSFSTSIISDDNWHRLTILRDGTNNLITPILDGTIITPATLTANAMTIDTNGLVIGQEQDSVGNAFDVNQMVVGIVDELQFNTNLSTDEAITEYNNQNSPSTFYSISNEIAYGNFTKKRFVYKVYDGATYKATWSDEVLNEPQFRNVINGGPGEIIIRLNRGFDSFGEDVDVKLNNRVELWISDRQYLNGHLLYKGFISGYRPVFQGNIEFVEITVLSYVFELGYYILRTGAGVTTIEYSNDTKVGGWDPAEILRDVIDKYPAHVRTLNYSATSIQDTNTTVSYTFKANTVRECIDKIIELAPIGWYWRIDPDSLIYFEPYNATSDHSFTIGTHINQMETWRRIEDVVNQIYFTGNSTEAGTGLYRVYQNAGSISSYGRHAIHMVDGRVTLSTTADTMANRTINNKKDPEIRTRLTILDDNGDLENRGYDIESIKPGDTMKIRNIKGSVKTLSLWDQFVWDVDIWDQTLTTTAADVIQILQIEYHLDSLVLEASSRTPEIAKRIEDIQRNLVQNQTVNNPITPVTG